LGSSALVIVVVGVFPLFLACIIIGVGFLTARLQK